MQCGLHAHITHERGSHGKVRRVAWTQRRAGASHSTAPAPDTRNDSGDLFAVSGRRSSSSRTRFACSCCRARAAESGPSAVGGLRGFLPRSFFRRSRARWDAELAPKRGLLRHSLKRISKSVMSGGLRLGNGRRAVSTDELGPDQVPIVRAEVPAHYGSQRGPFDRYATLQRNGTHPTRPLPDQLRLASDGLRDRGLPPPNLTDVLVQTHQAIIKRGASFKQASRSLLFLSVALQTRS